MNKEDLKKRIENNDNRCTATPYLLLLQEKVFYVGQEDYDQDGKEVFVERTTGDYLKDSNREELVSSLKESGYSTEDIEIERIWECYHWKTINVFLTDQGYEDHMKENGHNIGEHRTFGIHAFRNKEFDSILKLLKE